MKHLYALAILIICVTPILWIHHMTEKRDAENREIVERLRQEEVAERRDAVTRIKGMDGIRGYDEDGREIIIPPGTYPVTQDQDLRIRYKGHTVLVDTKTDMEGVTNRGTLRLLKSPDVKEGHVRLEVTPEKDVLKSLRSGINVPTGFLKGRLVSLVHLSGTDREAISDVSLKELEPEVITEVTRNTTITINGLE